ncbi:hypothetical protein TRFO_36055 [Tritrichomonas foetus]|uniref:RIIa domain-containing protein n=1 Tax=Tritrichomonas foetus TaxID=1144522 RepID=A0A1J4JF14_9EUKA|nr:hypothetical protein TRFO_36055 [Tritrichomonas foetus]|eukprot:OHS97688.1 hypothetical protein TRFO_36055 [Tritrichomonas foetus]
MSVTSRPRLNLPRPQRSKSVTQRAQTVSRDFFSKYPHVKTNMKFVLAGTSTFGKDAPRFTIPSSRRDDTPNFPSPGPGEYEITDPNNYRKIPPAFSKSRSASVKANPTANIDFINHRVFPETKPAYIGVRNNREFYDIIDSPGPNYYSMPSDTKLQHRILEKPKQRKVEKENLGPGSYDVNIDTLLKREPAYNFSGPKNRHDWMIQNDGQPGPGQYNPSDTVRTEPHWTIGRKSRPKRNAAPPPQKDLIAVDQCIIHLETLPNPSAARLYIMTHPELRNVVHELLEIVFESKPENPIELIENYFQEIRDSQQIDIGEGEDAEQESKD